MSASLFRSIKRQEMEAMGWTSKTKDILAPSIVNITNNFNSLSMWVTQEILNAEKIKLRFQILGYFIHVAYVIFFNKCCLEYKNFDGVKSIISGLQATPVHRLERTWALIGRKERDAFSKLEQITSIDNNNEK